MSGIRISNPANLAKLKAEILADGASKMHVLSDFDRTLTSPLHNGKKVPSIVSILRDSDIMPPGYAQESHALFNKYYPLENDPTLSHEERSHFMHEWWNKAFELLIKYKLTREQVRQVMISGSISLRTGAVQFLKLLADKNIPLIIFSSSALGVDGILMLLDHSNLLTENINIVSNQLQWGSDGRLVGVKEPLIHSANKSAATIRQACFYKQIEKRTNVILMGDNLDDAHMINGFDYDTLIKFGFLEDNVEALLPRYLKVFDAVICNNGDMAYLTQFIA